MQTSFTIKGITIGEGRPVVCVPVVAAEAADVVAKIRDLCRRNVQMIEWRVDCFRDVDKPEAVSAVLEEVKNDVSETVLLFTFRSVKQGGNRPMSENKIIYLNELAARSGVVDLVDLEFFEASKPEKSIRRLQNMGVRVIASHHDFERTPLDSVLHVLMDQMQQGGADIAKLAVMPKSVDDVLRILKLTNDTKQKYPTLPVVTMSMTGMGVISRVVGEAVGSCITFGADGQVSAPGQMQMDELGSILDALHKSIGK